MLKAFNVLHSHSLLKLDNSDLKFKIIPFELQIKEHF